MSKPVTATAVEKMRRWAKRHARENEISHSQALECAAQEAGFASWHEVQERVRAAAPSVPDDDLPVDPVLPPGFDDTSNEDRPKAQIDAWWLRPFVQSRTDGSFDVRCLDGGAHDRATYYGTARSLDEAREIARTKLAAWQRFRDNPSALLTESGYLLVLEPNWPGMPRPVLASAGTREGLDQILARWDETCARDPEAARLAITAIRERSARVPSYEAAERALERGLKHTLRNAEAFPVALSEVALVCAVYSFGGANAEVKFTLPEMASYLWEFGVDEENVASVLGRARQLESDGQAVIASASSEVQDGIAHWEVRIAPTAWLSARGFRRF